MAMEGIVIARGAPFFGSPLERHRPSTKLRVRETGDDGGESGHAQDKFTDDFETPMASPHIAERARSFSAPALNFAVVLAGPRATLTQSCD